MKVKFFAAILIAALTFTNVDAQNKLTREQILGMSIEELSDLPLEDLMEAVETLGVSSVDELFALIMNKNVSSASKEEENSFTSPLSTTVITKAEMRTYGITTIEEAFRLIPGMIITEKTNGIYDIHMRGLNNIPDNNMLLYTENANTLLMIDGRQVQNCIMGALTLDMLPISIEDIERIEVVRGACGALYGSNAINGVINIITEKPNQESHKVAGNIQMGNNNTFIGDVAFRKSWLNGKIATGLSLNMQTRGRNTDKLYVMGSAGRVIAGSQEIADATVNTQAFGNIANGYMTTVTGQKLFLGKDLIPVTKGGWYSLEEIQNARQIAPTAMPAKMLGIEGVNDNDIVYYIFNATEPETPLADMFHDTNVSRKNIGINGYITINPNADIRFDITAGYGKARAMSTPVGDDIFSLNERVSNTFYTNLNSHIYGLSFNFGYENGPQNYAYGVPGFKIGHHLLNASVDYTFKVGDLSIKPGFEYQWSKFIDYLPVFNDENYDQSHNYTWHYEKDAKTPEDNFQRLYGFLNGAAELSSLAPSIRLDYKIGDIRLIGAFRSDKTSIPDKWNHSWQFAANYDINNNNFIRLVYGHANRGANLVNTNANYQWLRTNMQPYRMVFVGNKESDLLKTDNIELGYRWKPVPSVLVDAELFYSRSQNFGALMSNETMITAESSKVYNTFAALIPQLFAAYNQMVEAGIPTEQIYANLAGIGAGAAHQLPLETRAYIKYDNLPYVANQYGLSLNLDWIISSKLIAKVNANVQQTRIDDYYQYSQTNQIKTQLAAAQAIATSNLYGQGQGNNMVSDLMTTVLQYGGSDPHALMNSILQYVPSETYRQQIGWSTMSPAEKENVTNKLYQAGITGGQYDGVKNPLAMYYSLKYDVLMSGNTLYFGNSSAEPYTLSSNHKHKATPTVFGMVGLIYKPIDALTVSAFGNYTGKRTYDTTAGSETLNDRFTVNMKIGYNPIKNFEVFVNAHNLFNTEKQEFVYCDKIGGLYTVGVSFGM